MSRIQSSPFAQVQYPLQNPLHGISLKMRKTSMSAYTEYKAQSFTLTSHGHRARRPHPRE